MWTPATDTNIEDAAISMNNLLELLDLMYFNFNTMGPDQAKALTELALSISSDVSTWMREEEKRREQAN